MIQQGKNLDEMSVVELKAMAYDLIALAENNQKNLQMVNIMIERKSRPELIPEVK